MNRALKWLLFIIIIIVVCVAISAAFVMYGTVATVKKPAIYLYPEEDSRISVVLDINGGIIKDIPDYNDGWDVFVTKDGLIENQYDYLFYENTLGTIDLPEEGWVVARDDLYYWFDANLPRMGLNEKEEAQFKEYWMPELTDSEYYEIKLFDIGFLNENMDLIIIPEPDTEIRLIFSFRAVDGAYEIESPEIVTPVRDGFTVVEWGGAILY